MQVGVHQHDVVAVGVADVRQEEHVTFGAAVGGEGDVHFRLLARALDALDLRDCLLAALDDRGLRLLGTEAIDEALLLG